ncbi:universal stress protein [Kitasatospora sp. NPDC001660]
MHRIVVGVDGSAVSRLALRRAVDQARLTGAVVEAEAAWTYPTISGADLLVSGRRGYGGFEWALPGSASRALRGARPCPVVVVPAAAGGPFRGELA